MTMPPLIARSCRALLRWIVRWQNALVGIALLAALLVGVRLWPHRPLSAWLPSSTAVYDARGRLLRLTLASDQRYRLWVPLKDVSPALIDGVAVTPMVMGGREMHNWLHVLPEHLAADEVLGDWIERGMDYARSLPPK